MQSSRLDRFFVTVFLIDILFLPFLLPVPVPISAAILPIWALMTLGPRSSKMFLFTLAGCASALASYLWGSQFRYSLDLVREANTFIVVFMFVAFQLMRGAEIDNIRFTLILLRAYIAFVFLLALYFFVDPVSYFGVRDWWGYRQGEIEVSTLTVITRFTGTLSDPNNMAVALCAVTATVTSLEPRRILFNAALIAMTGISVVATMSTTGVICFTIMLVAFVFGMRLSLPAKAFAAAISLTALAAVYALIRDTVVFALAFERLEASELDSRLTRWMIAFDIHEWQTSVILGDGGVVLWGAHLINPHNGHFHLIFGFGLICYLAFAAIFFRVPGRPFTRPPLFLAIMVIGFTVNVGIYEHRFAGIWTALLAIYTLAGAIGRMQRSPRRAQDIPLEGRPDHGATPWNDTDITPPDRLAAAAGSWRRREASRP